MPMPVSEMAIITYRPGYRRPMLRGVIVVDLDVGGFERQRAALGHRVAGVDRQIEQDLVDLAGIGEHRAERRRRADDERDVLADQPIQHLVRVGDQVVEVEPFWAAGSACG